jgi:hypothetical protein
MALPEAGWPARHLSGYERIHEQFRHYHGHGNCLMLTAYLSKSHLSILNEYVAVAGFYGHDDQWTALSLSWKQALGCRKSLRMKTLRIDSKPQRAKCLLDAPAPIPERHGLKPLCSLVRIADYMDLIKDGTQATTALAGYLACLSTILIALNHAIPGHESIKVVCEIQRDHEKEAVRMFRLVTRGMADPAKPYFSGIEFVQKDSSVFMQPADFLADAARRWREDKKSVAATICRPILGNRAALGYEISRPLARDIVNLLNIRTHSSAHHRGPREPESAPRERQERDGERCGEGIPRQSWRQDSLGHAMCSH